MRYMRNESNGILFPFDKETYELGGFVAPTKDDYARLGLEDDSEELHAADRIPIPAIEDISRQYMNDMFNAYGDKLGQRIPNSTRLMDAREEFLARVLKYNRSQGSLAMDELALPENFDSMNKRQLAAFAEERGIVGLDTMGRATQVRARIIAALDDLREQAESAAA